MAVDAGFIRKAESDFLAMAVCQFAGFGHGFFGFFFVPEITFQINNPGAFDNFFVDVCNREHFGSAEIGEHGTFGVGRDQNDAAAGNRSFV